MGIDRIKDAPRPQHYHFAHQYLRERAQENPKELVNRLSRESGTSYLSSLWVSLGLAFKNERDGFISANGLGCFPVRINDDYYGVIVQFPQPERMAEAYFVAIIVQDSESKQTSDEEQSATYRYFTLEFSKNTDGSKQTVLGEWEGSSHLYIDAGFSPDIEIFVEAIRQLESMSAISTRKILEADRRDEAISLMRQQRYADALVLFKQLLANRATDWSLLYMTGQCYRFTDNLDSAIIYLRRAAELKSDESSVLLALGIAFQLTNRFTEAVDTFRRAIEVDPDSELAYNSLALTQKKQGELELALHNYDAGIKALSRRIIKSLQNDRSSRIFKHQDIEHTLWIEYAMYGALYLCSVSGIEVLASPSSELAMEEERTERHRGLYWIDSVNSENKRVRLFLPNYFNTFVEMLKQDRAYSNLIGNRGTVLELLGRNEEADQHFGEAEYFRPSS